MWDRLQRILEREVELHRELKHSLSLLREAIVLRDVGRLEEVLEVQANLGREIQRLETERTGLCRELVGEKERLVRISEVIERSPATMKAVFRNLQEELVDLLKGIQREVRVMRYVVRTVLGYVEEMISIFTAGELLVYDATGSKVKKKGHMYSASA